MIYSKLYNQSLLINFLDRFNKPILLIYGFIACSCAFQIYNYFINKEFSWYYFLGCILFGGIVSVNKTKNAQLEDIWNIFILLRWLFSVILFVAFLVGIPLNKMYIELLWIVLMIVPSVEFFIKNESIQSIVTIIRFSVFLGAIFCLFSSH